MVRRSTADREDEAIVIEGFVVRQMERWELLVRIKMVPNQKERVMESLGGLVNGYMDSRGLDHERSL